MSVSYNFPSNSVINNPKDMFQNNALAASSESHVVNFAYESTHYFVKSVSMVADSGTKYFVIQSETEAGEVPQNFFNVAIPLANSTDSTDITRLITAAKNSTTSYSINLNNVFSTLIGTKESGSSGKVATRDDTKYFVAATQLKADLNGLDSLQSESIPSDGTQVSLVQSHIGWDLSCVLLDEKGHPYENPTTNTAVPTTDSANTLVLMTLVIMVAGAIYILAPIVYPFLFEGAKSINKDISDSAFNWFWFIVLMLSTIPPIVLAATSQKSSYFLLALTYGLSYFAGTAGVVKSIKDNDRVENGAFVSDDKLFTHICNLFFYGENLNLGSGIFAFVFVFIGFILEYVGIGLGGDNKDGEILYAVGSVIYIVTIIGKFVVLAMQESSEKPSPTLASSSISFDSVFGTVAE